MQEFGLQDKEGERMAIMVDAHMPRRGVLALLDREEKGGPFLITDNKRYPIVSLRQPPELCGIEEPILEAKEKEAWTIPYREVFCKSLQRAIEESNISELVLASGGIPWNQSPYSTLVSDIEFEETTLDVVATE